MTVASIGRALGEASSEDVPHTALASDPPSAASVTSKMISVGLIPSSSACLDQAVSYLSLGVYAMATQAWLVSVMSYALLLAGVAVQQHNGEKSVGVDEYLGIALSSPSSLRPLRYTAIGAS